MMSLPLWIKGTLKKVCLLSSGWPKLGPVGQPQSSFFFGGGGEIMNFFTKKKKIGKMIATPSLSALTGLSLSEAVIDRHVPQRIGRESQTNLPDRASCRPSSTFQAVACDGGGGGVTIFPL